MRGIAQSAGFPKGCSPKPRRGRNEIGFTAFATSPVTVEYAIMPLGMTLAATVDALRIRSAEKYRGGLGRPSPI